LLPLPPDLPYQITLFPVFLYEKGLKHPLSSPLITKVSPLFHPLFLTHQGNQRYCRK